MPQEFKSIRASQIVKISELGIGQLGEIVGDSEYAGIVITRCCIGFVTVYGNDRKTAFECCWFKDGLSYTCGDLEVRLLEPGEYVKLTN